MKRFNTILASLMLFSAVVLMPVHVSAFVPYGDVNWSTDVNIDDVVRLIDDLLTGEASIADDVDGNLTVNINDVTILIDYLLGNEVDSFNAANAHVNDDDDITIADVSALIDMLLSGEY